MDRNESECFILEQVVESYHFLALVTNILWNKKYAVSEGHQKAQIIDVDLVEEASGKMINTMRRTIIHSNFSLRGKLISHSTG